MAVAVAMVVVGGGGGGGGGGERVVGWWLRGVLPPATQPLSGSGQVWFPSYCRGRLETSLEPRHALLTTDHVVELFA